MGIIFPSDGIKVVSDGIKVVSDGIKVVSDGIKVLRDSALDFTWGPILAPAGCNKRESVATT